MQTSTTTFDNPYLTSELIGDTEAALPDWPDLTASTPGTLASNLLGFRNLNSSETSYTIVEAKYAIWHPIPPAGIFKITWIERFTPASGAAPVDTPRAYTWDGAIPSDYDPANPATWPFAGAYEVDAPDTNGEITLESFAWRCTE